MKSSRVLAALSAFFSVSVAACGASTSAPGDTGGQSAAGDATTAGADGTATSSGGASSLGGASAAGSAGGGLAGGTGTGGATVAGTGGAEVVGTAGALGGGGGGGVAGGGGAAGGGAGTAGLVAGTMSIFDGATLSGWQQGTAMYFSVKDGLIDGKGTGTVHGQLLVTQADYGDFRIVVSSNMVATGGSGHLGICFWGGRTPVGQYNDCKLIIPPGGTSAGLNTWDYKLGGGLNKTSSAGTPAILHGWNTTEILCWLAKGLCRVALNGTAALTYQEQNLSSIKAGPIGLQIHDGTNEEVQYKDVFVDPAPTVDQLLTVK